MSEEAKNVSKAVSGCLNAMPEQVRTQAANMAEAYASGMAAMAAIVAAAQPQKKEGE